jgi:hypothetical protein
MKVVKLILLFSLAVNCLLIFISIELFFEKNNFFRKKPELIDKISTNIISEAKIQFNNIVQEKFPIGLSEMELIRELGRQGFIPGWPYENEKSAVFVTSNIACNSVWSIIWKVDKHGNVTEINGRYIAGCL